jgi:hypothetical protein
VADGGKDDVGRIALAPLEMTATEVSVGLHVTDHRLDGTAAPELTFDHPRTPRFWPEMKTRPGFVAL